MLPLALAVAGLALAGSPEDAAACSAPAVSGNTATATCDAAGLDSFPVPALVDAVTIDVFGAQGGDKVNDGGGGGEVRATLSRSGGYTLDLEIGSAGVGNGTAGVPGGGAGGSPSLGHHAGGGGGMSIVSVGATRLMIGGGGGGAGYDDGQWAWGGNGGGLNGDSACGCLDPALVQAAGGGTQSAGGAGTGGGSSGAADTGGAGGATTGGGGGGGGYYGGGGGGDPPSGVSSGGGGGSGYVNTGDASNPMTSVTYNSPSHAGDGLVVITYVVPQAHLTSAATANFSWGASGSFNVTSTGNPKPTISLDTPLPAGLTFTPGPAGSGTGSITGAPTAAPGTYPVTARAANGSGPDDTRTVNVVVSATQPSWVTGATSATFTEGLAGSFGFDANGSPKPALSESGKLPSGVVFTDQGNGHGELSGTPVAGTAGSYPVILTASNGPGSSRTKNFTLGVAAGANSSQNGAQSPAPDPPVVNKSVVVAPSGGTVLVKVPGSKKFVQLKAGEQLPLGTIVDATNGKVVVTSAQDKSGATQSALFYGGIFKVTQVKANGEVITQLELAGPKPSCTSSKRATASRKKKKRSLWGDGKGKFGTKGTYGSATVRGTKWYVEDNCSGTLVKVARGVVAVRDFARKKTTLVKAGRSLLVRPLRRG
ncbi:MAG: putative Ig domain-containing protein [Thermoleophilaceae bacterium]